MICTVCDLFQYDRVVKSLGEDPKKTKPEDFFGIFDVFLNSFTEAKAENERFRKQKEEEERRQKLEAQV